MTGDGVRKALSGAQEESTLRSHQVQRRGFLQPNSRVCSRDLSQRPGLRSGGHVTPSVLSTGRRGSDGGLSGRDTNAQSLMLPPPCCLGLRGGGT